MCKLCGDTASYGVVICADLREEHCFRFHTEKCGKRLNTSQTKTNA